MKIKLGVIFGGETVEHEVSIISALQAIKNLDENKYEIIPIYISKDRIWYTGNILFDIETYKDFDSVKKYAKKVCLYKKGKEFFLQSTSGLFRRDVAMIDIAFPIVHGNNVEDGTLCGYLDSVGIPYVGSHVLGASLGQDKVAMKQIMSACNIPVVDYTWFYENEYLEHEKEILSNIKTLGYPVIVKPATLGSSVGITKVSNENKIKEAIEEAISYDNKVVVEKCIENLVEVNASVLGNYEYMRVSPLEEVMGEDEILSYKDKYLGGSKKTGKMTSSKGMASTSRIIPARISKKLETNIKNTSKDVFRILNLSGVCRIDYLINGKTEEYYVNEPNTIPGSLAFYLWKEDNVPYRELLDEMISIAIKEYKNKSKKVRSFESNILEGFNGSKGSKGLKGLKN